MWAATHRPAPSTLRLTCRTICCNCVCATRQALEAPTAYGVMGMRERARQLGGQLSITSEPGQGSCLQLLIPLELS